MLKKEIKLLFTLFNTSNFKKNFFFYIKSPKQLKKIKPKSLIIFIGKKNFFLILYFFIYLLVKGIKFKKNFMVFFKIKSSIIGQQIIPIWPGNYQKSSLALNFYLWLKKILYIFYYKKNLYLIVIDLN